MKIERLHYPELNRRKPSKYMDNLYQRKHHPDTISSITDSSIETLNTVDDDGRLMLCAYATPENADGISGNGYKLLGIKAWEKCFTHTNDADFNIMCLNLYGKRHYDYVWCEIEGDELDSLEVLREFRIDNNKNILISFKDDQINWVAEN